LQVDTNGVTLPNATTGTAANGLCINASNQVITCSTGGSSPSLSFTNASEPIAVFPPLSTEATAVSVTTPVTAGDEIKIDDAFGVNFVTTANWSFVFEVRLYRDGTLIQTVTENRSG